MDAVGDAILDCIGHELDTFAEVTLGVNWATACDGLDDVPFRVFSWALIFRQ